jgi:hypothetical protein
MRAKKSQFLSKIFLHYRPLGPSARHVSTILPPPKAAKQLCATLRRPEGRLGTVGSSRSASIKRVENDWRE